MRAALNPESSIAMAQVSSGHNEIADDNNWDSAKGAVGAGQRDMKETVRSSSKRIWHSPFIVFAHFA
jgi:hypothetical protein